MRVFEPTESQVTEGQLSKVLIKRQALAVAYKVALAHLVFGSLWIVFSDTAAQAIAKDVEQLSRIQTFKGLAFIALAATVASGVVYGLTRQLLQRKCDQLRAEGEVIERLAMAADWRDDETGEHVRRVAKVSSMLACKLGLAPDVTRNIEKAAALHDVGKIGIDDDVIKYEGIYNDEQRKVMQQHTEIGGQILREPASGLMFMAHNVALYHHERWDGGGYPHGLNGEEIPIEARCVAVADVLDALVSQRRYKAAWPWEQVRKEIIENSGKQFDPEVVEAFVALEPELRELYRSYEPIFLFKSQTKAA